MRTSLFLLFLPFLSEADINMSYPPAVAYPPFSQDARPQTFATDAEGNLFIVSNMTTPSGRPQIHVDKTDANGRALGRL